MPAHAAEGEAAARRRHFDSVERAVHSLHAKASIRLTHHGRAGGAQRRPIPYDADARWHQRPLTEVAVERVRRNVERHGLFDEQVRFIVGWFRNSSSIAPVDAAGVYWRKTK